MYYRAAPWSSHTVIYYFVFCLVGPQALGGMKYLCVPLLLLERIIHRLRKKDIKKENILNSQVAAMASDQEIQSELRKINEEIEGSQS
jgi:hypothetical protein